MRKKITLLFTMSLVLFTIMLLFPSLLFAAPVEWSENGHYYLLVETELTWDNAKSAARSMSYKGNRGYLATITSAEEQAFINDNIELASDSECWLGGYQEWEPGDRADEGWQWVTGETWSYTNWNLGEPSDSAPIDEGVEDSLVLSRIVDFFYWNDLWDTERSFLVEFGGFGTISPKPLSPQDWVLKDLNIDQLLSLYGPTPEGLVKMLYDTILGRVPDADGQNHWVEQLNSGALNGSQVVEHFVFSQELGAKIEAMTNEEFITFLYNSFLSRNPDSEGFNSWVAYMNSGVSKLDTLRAFMDNQEWFDVCSMFNVVP